MSLLALGLAVSAVPASAAEEWKWGINFYDLQLRNLPEEGSVVTDDICASSLTYMASIMRDEGKTETQHQLATIARAWAAEGMKKHAVDEATYREKYLVPAFGLMRQLEDDDLTFWATHCIELTRRYVE